MSKFRNDLADLERQFLSLKEAYQNRGHWGGAVVWYDGCGLAPYNVRVTLPLCSYPHGAVGAIRVHKDVESLLAEAREIMA